MDERIEELADLFRQREEIDSEIKEILAGCVVVSDEVEINSENVERIINKTKKSILRELCSECGSKGRRHKKGCSKSKNKGGFLLASKEMPKKEIHSYICRECRIPFKSNIEKIDAFCPECQSVNVDDYDESSGVITYKS